MTSAPHKAQEVQRSGERPEDRIVPLVVVLSLALHAAGIWFAVWFAAQEPPKLQPTHKPVSAKLVRLGKPRDKRLLPRLPTAPPPPPAPQVAAPPPATSHSAPPPTSGKTAVPTRKHAEPQTSSNAQKSHANRTALANAARRQSLFSAFASTAAPGPVEDGEPVGEEDGDPEGDSDTAEEGERYFGLILAKARRHYDVSKSISPKELIRLKATVILYIDGRGNLVKDPELQVSSGNALFDQEVLAALKKAAPFGPPPGNLAETLKTVGVAIEATP